MHGDLDAGVVGLLKHALEAVGVVVELVVSKVNANKGVLVGDNKVTNLNKNRIRKLIFEHKKAM